MRLRLSFPENTPEINAATRGQKVLVSGSGMNADYANPKAFKAGGNLTVNGGTCVFSDPGWLMFPNRVYRVVGAD